MTVLFISYWGIKDGLTRSTVIPHVKILSEFNEIENIYLITVERGKRVAEEIIDPKIKHIPIFSRSFSFPLIDKIVDFIKIPHLLAKLINEKKINKVIARSAPAGVFAYLLLKKTHIPFYVESFEPHAAYMLETSTWHSWDIRYILQKRWEKKQFNLASGLMPVTENYRKALESVGIDKDKMITVPCGVDLELFKFNLNDRKLIRRELFIDHHNVGIYVGKFGGLYLRNEAAQFFRTLFNHLTDFFLIILTPDLKFIKNVFSDLNISDSKYFITNVPHNTVPQYLSASDFGMALYKSFPSNKYLSPIKIGEYWANGLPVMLTNGVGDESQFLELESGGALFDIYNPIPALEKIEMILKSTGHRSRIFKLAEKYRSLSNVRNAYVRMIMNN